MKPSQSSLYRDLENLALWFIPVSNRIPNQFGLRVNAERIINEINNAITVCALALQEADIKTRLELINTLVVHLTTVKSVIKVLVEWSMRGTPTARIISTGQRAEFYTLMTKIGAQLAGWKKSTASYLN